MFKKLSLSLQPIVLFLIVTLPVIHLCVIKVAQSLSFENAVIVVWPSVGIYLATVLVFGYRVWPAILLSELIGNSTIFGFNWLSIVISFVDLIDPLLVAFLIHRMCKGSSLFLRSQNVFKFMGIILVEPVLTSTLGVTAFCLGGVTPWSAYAEAWESWWLSIFIGLLIATPALLVWSPKFSPPPIRPHYWIFELTLLLLLILAIAAIAFTGGYPLEYLLLPLLVWSVFRFSLRETTLLILIVSAIAIWGTKNGFGSFVRSSSSESLVLLQSFVGVIALTSLVLSAVLHENRQATSQLKQANEELEDRVEERTFELTKALQKLQKTQQQMLQSEKMSSLGQLVAGIAHEINNPVNFIYGNLSHLNQYSQDLVTVIQTYQQHYPHPPQTLKELLEDVEIDFITEDINKIVCSMRLGTDRIRQIVLSLRNFSRLDEAEIKTVDIHEGIDSTLVILQHRLKAKSDRPAIDIVKEYGKIPLIECYAGQLNQVLMNILSNAIDALEEIATSSVGQICIITELINPQSVRIIIADNGNGIPEAFQTRIFDPFFTTKPTGKGTGMVMSISYQIITEKHGGKLYFDSIAGKGTKFIIEIPIKQAVKV
ncbi:MASE1 domain-containing protein [Aerosakkonemataceae cyanobacterium BLCC-F50]|uniref:histidine kinase n=1 Tax=Floridaenema flaviceps BLCC-F50 TaxID=3153642 RepID=A0ABV4XYX2_9CYAN